MSRKLPLSLSFSLSLILLLSFLSSSQAAKQWSVLNGAWSDANNWTPQGVPGVDDDVIINSNEDLIVTLNDQAAVRSLLLGGGAGHQTLLLSGAILSLSNGGTIDTTGILDVASGTLEGNGTLAVDGLAKFRDLNTKTITRITLSINGNMTLDAGGIELTDSAGITISPAGTLTITSKDGIVNNDKTDTTINIAGTVISSSGLNQDYTSTISSTIVSGTTGRLLVPQGKLMISNNGGYNGELDVSDGASVEILSGNHTFETTSSIKGNGTIFVANSANVKLIGTLEIKLIDINGGGAIVSVLSDKGVTFNQLSLKNGQPEGDSAMVSDLSWEGGSMSLRSIYVDNLHTLGSLARTLTGTQLAIGKTASFAAATNVLLYEKAAVIISETATMVLDTQIYFLCGINDTSSTVQVEGELYINYTAGIQVTCPLSVQQSGAIYVTKGSLSVQAPFSLQGNLSVANNSHVDFSVGGPTFVGSNIYGDGELSCFACDLTIQGYIDIGGITFTGGSITFEQDDSESPYLPHIRFFNQSGSSVLQLTNFADVGLNLTIDTLEFTGGQIKSNLNSLFGVNSALVISKEAHFHGGSPVLMQDLHFVNYGDVTFSGSQPAELSGRNEFVNAEPGTWILNGQITFSQSDQQSGYTSIFDNYGILETEQDSTVTLSALNFNNYGGVAVRERASLSFQQASYIQTGSAESETVLFGGTLSSPSAINILSGRLMGYGTVTGDVLLKGALIATTQISGDTVTYDTPLRIQGSLVQRQPGVLGVALEGMNGTAVVTGQLIVENTYQLWGGSLVIQSLDEVAVPEASLVFATFKNKIGNDYDVITNANINSTYGYSLNVGTTSVELVLSLNPVVTSISPATGPTDGTTSVTITGTNFVNSPTLQVLFGDKQAKVTGWNGDNIIVEAPAGTGKDLPVCIVVDGRGCSTGSPPPTAAVWSYTPPTIDSISTSNNNKPTEGGNEITIKGANFGGDSAEASVTVGSSNCVISSITHTTIVCTVPAGSGASNVLNVVIGGQDARSTYSYDGPSVGSTSPSTISTRGGERVLVISSNVITNTTLVDVTIDSRPCTNLTITQLEGSATPHQTAITCTTPALSRTGTVDLVVTVAGQKSTATKITVSDGKGGKAPSVWKQAWWVYLVFSLILIAFFAIGFVTHLYWIRREGYQRVN